LYKSVGQCPRVIGQLPEWSYSRGAPRSEVKCLNHFYNFFNPQFRAAEGESNG
jgi:hypothetical protein